MKLDQIKELLETVTQTDVTELELETKEAKIRIRRGPAEGQQAPYVVVASPLPGGEPVARVAEPPPATPQPPAPVQPTPATPAEPQEDDGLVIVTSPIVGTYYESPSPGAPAFVDIGDEVQAGQVICIIEAMKLMNEIEAETSGVVAKRFVQNSQPVEYGEALFAIRPS